jgi:hypothetical protein
MLAGMGELLTHPAFLDLENPAVARALVQHILDHGHIVGLDHRSREVMRFEFPLLPGMLENLATFGAASADLEPEPLDDDEREEDRVRTVEPEYARPRRLSGRRRRAV